MDPLRQAEVRNLISTKKLCLAGLLKTKVPDTLFGSISDRLVSGWNWVANYEFSHRGRIWIGWNPSLVTFEVISSNSLVIHGRLRFLTIDICCCVSVVYAEHTFVAPRPLWANLVQWNSVFQGSAWLVAGDFNAIKDPSDRIGGSNTWIPSFDDFNQCLFQSELEDFRYIGFRFTWSTSSGANRKARKIDRVLVNVKWSQDFSYSEASFLAPGISNHTPMVVRVMRPVFSRRPFKFFDFWTKHPSYHSIVSQVWETPCVGVPMFRLVSKMKILKGRLKQLNR